MKFSYFFRYGSPHHSRSQSVKTPGSRSSGRPNYLCLPQQRSRVASMPNTGVEEEYYRLRHFSITTKGVVNRGDSLKSRRSRSNNSVASSNSRWVQNVFFYSLCFFISIFLFFYSTRKKISAATGKLILVTGKHLAGNEQVNVVHSTIFWWKSRFLHEFQGFKLSKNEKKNRIFENWKVGCPLKHS